ncbi:hypothetical protein G6F42_019370 [Rhizopus arrhizus]|nr:hypothetical protein G6F42_019370 [Rhizopus arrhizus]
MSWRGVKKSISRLPHQFKTRNGGEDVTRDLEYLELEKRYKEIVAAADELRLETTSYRDHIATNDACRHAQPPISLRQLLG